MTSHPHVSVAICTLDRPHGLQLLLEAIDRQNLGAWPDDAVTILVIDNSVSGSVRALCTVRAEASRFRLVHVHEARRGLSFARNAALAASRDIGASHVAFVDDDEVPDPQWLSALHARLIETGAAAAVGPVRPVFENHPPRWAVAGGFFAKALDGRDHDLNDAYTCNVMVETATVTRHRLAFEARFNITGGEDTLFFAGAESIGRPHHLGRRCLGPRIYAGNPGQGDMADETLVSNRGDGSGTRSARKRIRDRPNLQCGAGRSAHPGRFRARRFVRPHGPDAGRASSPSPLHGLSRRRSRRGRLRPHVLRICGIDLPGGGHEDREKTGMNPDLC